MSSGTIKTLKTDKAFGFITPDDKKPEDRDLFFHKNSVVDPAGFEGLMEGDRVTYDVEQSEKGPNAVNVKKA
jgi:CspA family cold shock protein